MEDVTREMADHSKECELLEVKKSLTRETSSQKEKLLGLEFSNAV